MFCTRPLCLYIQLEQMSIEIVIAAHKIVSQKVLVRNVYDHGLWRPLIIILNSVGSRKKIIFYEVRSPEINLSLSRIGTDFRDKKARGGNFSHFLFCPVVFLCGD